MVSQDDTESKAGAIQIMQALRSKIESGALKPGGHLPAVRQLSRAHGIAPNTALRALRMLADQGLIEAHPRRGYWVREEKSGPATFAYLLSTENIHGGWDALYKVLMQELKACAGTSQAELVTVIVTPGEEQQTLRQHAISAVNGLVLDSLNEPLLAWARRNNTPAVLIDDVDPLKRLNSVIQDGFEGGELAVEHLLSTGCKRIAWFGKALDHHHARARYGGAKAKMIAVQREFSSEHFLAMDAQALMQAARALLTTESAPDGIVALWRPMVSALATVAQQLGLKIGVDFKLIGWSCEELYESSFVPLFEGPPPPAVVWSARRMAEVAMDSLRAKSAPAAGQAMTTLIPVSIRPGA